MPDVLLLHDPKPPFETRRLIGLVIGRISGIETVALYPHRVLPTVTSLVRGQTEWPVVHAFGFRALGVAVVAARGQIVYSASRFPRRTDIAWMRAILRYRRVRIVCDSDAERRAWVTGGVPMDLCTLIRPGVPLTTSTEARATARQRFGFTENDQVVFTALPSAGAGRSDAVWTGCLLNVLDPKVKTLAWAEHNLESLESLRTRQIDPTAMAIVTDATPDAGFAAADVVLVPPAETVSPTLMAMAMASGRPIVAFTTAAVCEMLEDRHTALLTGGHTPKILAERVIDVLRDAELGRKIADRARTEVYDYFLPSRLLADYRTLYADCTDEVPRAVPAGV